MRRIVLTLFCFLSVAVGLAQPFTNVFVGTRNNDNTGDSLATAFGKLNFADNWIYTNLVTISNLIGSGSGTGDMLKSQNLSGLASVSTARANIGVVDVDSIAGLLALTPANVQRYVQVGGYYSSGDGGGGIFVWNSSSTLSTNRGTCFKDGAGDSTGRWLRVYNRLAQKLDVKWFGAKGDDLTDDTAAVTDAFSQTGALPNMTLELSGGYGSDTYRVTALNISISNFSVIGRGTLKFTSTNAAGMSITGNNWKWDGPNIDGNNVSASGFFLNGTKHWSIKNSIIKNIYGDDNAGSAQVIGIALRKSTQDGLIADCVITNVSHLTNGTRVSRAISLSDFGTAGTNDNVTGITISRVKMYNIGAGEEGDCIAVNTLRSYSVGLIVSECHGYNFGHRFLKLEGSGVIGNSNWAESYSNNGGTNGLVYSGFSSYGTSNIFNGNTIIGNFSLGVEFGSYTPSFEAYYGQAKDNLIFFTTANAQTNGVGIELTQRAYDIQVSGNIVVNGKYAARLQGDVSNCQFGMTLATNQTVSGIITQTDGTNAPSHCDLGDLRIQTTNALYGVNIQAGTNINYGSVHGSTASALVNRGAGVTGTFGVEADSQLATASSLMKFDSQLRAVNADLTGDVTTSGGVATTIANQAVTYAKMQNVSATQRVHGRNSAGAGVTEEVTASQLFDWLGSTRGSILYRGASGWSVLAPGTSGYVLTSNGSGADPTYQASSGGSGGGTVGTLINTTATTAGQLAVFIDGTKTNIAPSTNFTVNATGDVSVNSLSIGPSRTNSSLTMIGKIDSLAGASITVTNNSTNIALIYYPTILNAGLLKLVNNGTSNWFTTNAVAGTDYRDTTALVNADISASAAIALTKLATVANDTILGNGSGSTAVPSALSALPKGISIVSGAAGTSNTNKISTRKTLWLDVDRVSGTSATMSVSDTTARGFGNVSFTGNTAATNSNFIEFSCIVPKGIDTSQDLIVEALRFKTTGTQTTAVNFDIGMTDIADSSAADPTSFSNWVAMGSGTLTSPAAGDQFTIKNKTLTSWKSSVTALDGLKIRMDRNDSNTDAVELKQLMISYVESQ